MIEKIRLKFGSSLESPKLELSTTPITIFVGPNNSGKSKVLREIQQYCGSGATNNQFVIIDDIQFNEIEAGLREQLIKEHTLSPNPNERINQGNILFGNGMVRHQLNAAAPDSFLNNPNANKSNFCRYFLSFKTLLLNGLNRINLVNDQGMGDLQQAPQNNLATLFQDDEKRLEVRRIINEAFNLYFVLDPTNSGQLRIRLSKTTPENHQVERGLHKEAVEFHKQAMHINEASDGVKAFTGIITSIVAGNPKITILDEPEAFLHPALSFKLGKEVGTTSKVALNKLFVSTHSSNFLMGCIQSGAPLNVVRLTYSNEKATARILNNAKINQLMRDPMLRSTGVLNALFYEFVVVVEGDSDRAFYQEINERLSLFNSQESVPNCLFINSQGKDTIWKIVQPLREMGIPTAAIFDIDILKNEGNNWTNAMKACSLPEITIQNLSQTRSQIKKKLVDSGKDMKKDGGINLLEAADKEAAENMFNQLEEYGLFVVRNGEVESWLSNLGVKVHKSVWLSSMFEKMGSNPESADYLKPTDDDVWAFMGEIKKWMSNNLRKGIPIK